MPLPCPRPGPGPPRGGSAGGGGGATTGAGADVTGVTLLGVVGGGVTLVLVLTDAGEGDEPKGSSARANAETTNAATMAAPAST